MFAGGVVARAVLLAYMVVTKPDTGVVCATPSRTTNNCYRVFAASGVPRGLVVLLPYFGSDANAFNATTLPTLLSKRGVTSMAVSASGYLTDADLETLKMLVAQVMRTNQIDSGKLVIGGVSAGGTGAVRYAEYCLSGHCSRGITPAGVFSVDAPLDFERWWNAQTMNVRRNNPKSSLEESKAILDALREALGGPPGEARAIYRDRSPFLATERDGGNARWLKSMPIRLYTEPDVVWAIEHIGYDYYTMNAIDQAALVLQLRAFGNARAELIITTGRGFRPSGVRNPHSWTIVDEPQLADWIIRLLDQ